MSKIDVFFACNANSVKETYVSIFSLVNNANKNVRYNIHILHDDENIKTLSAFDDLASKKVTIIRDNIKNVGNIKWEKLLLRPGYDRTIYYKFFMPLLYPKLNKAIYLDSDILVLKDISKLFGIKLGNNLIGAVQDKSITSYDKGQKYIEKVLGVDVDKYFNGGVYLINLKEAYNQKTFEQFIELSDFYAFKVAQDQDYLNVLYKGKVLYIDAIYNEQVVSGNIDVIDNIKILHFNGPRKPWLYKEIQYSDMYWNMAKQTKFYGEFVEEFNNYKYEDRESDKRKNEVILSYIDSELRKEDYYLIKKARSLRKEDRLTVLQRRKEYELDGKFDVDLEDDVPGRELLPNEINYIRKKKIDKMKVNMAFTMARKFIDKMLDERQLIIKEVKGIENLQSLDGGAIITCNHFNALDSFAIQIVYENSKHFNKKQFYRIIKEGNYTSFPGFYGFLMRNCNTLPLSSNHETMKKFLRSVKELLDEGNLVLIYPEQAMWWNYRKPRPLKSGGFTIAVNNNVPVLPVFITMEDSNIIDGDGFFVQEYTINIAKPIYPKQGAKRSENVEYMMEENAKAWKEIYEDFYHEPLTYNTREQK